MQLIATRSFRNTNGKIQIEGAPNAVHIPKGTVFAIGRATTHAELEKESDEDAKFVATLFRANCIGDGSNAEFVKQVQAEVQAETEAEERRAKSTLGRGVARLH